MLFVFRKNDRDIQYFILKYNQRIIINEMITLNEVNNDGKSIYLYFNGLVGLYATYGYSAYLLSRITDAKVSYSDSMQMPVVVINAEHLEELTKELTVKSLGKGFYCLEANEAVDENAYADWAAKARKG